jgi:glutathione peroxidase-family protein
MAKSDVNGPNTNDVFRYLRLKSSLHQQEDRAKQVPWNFSKFLVTADLSVVEFVDPTTDPSDLMPLIEAALQKTKVLIE